MEPLKGKTPGTLRPESVSTRLQRVAQLAGESAERVLTTLAHHIDVEFMREAWRQTRKDGATGIDNQTAKDFAVNLEENLEKLVEELHKGTYRAPAVRRTYIPKGDGKSLRPIGIPTLRDKVMQRAIQMILEAVYEVDFLDCSWGFRPGRSVHQAVASLRQELMEMEGGWLIEVDIKSYFDTVNHGHLRNFLDQRVRDGVVRRMIGKWLNAGVMEGVKTSYPEDGTPQGGVISPLLSNIYLHEVLDKWFETVAKPRLQGKAYLVRYADDVVIVCEMETDARRLMEVLPKRFGAYGLTLHPTKTRLIDFRQPSFRARRSERDTFEFLGFTWYWGRTRRGGWAVWLKTSGKRLTRALKSVNQWCRKNRHLKVREQIKTLSAKLRGHYQFYGVPGNSRALSDFRYWVRRIWKKWLSRRGQRSHFTWEKFSALEKRYPLPPAQLSSSYGARA